MQVCAGSLDGLRSVEQVLVSEKGVSPQEVAHVAVLGHLVVLDRAALKVMGSAFTTAAPPAAPAAPLCPVASSLGGGEEVRMCVHFWSIPAPLYPPVCWGVLLSCFPWGTRDGVGERDQREMRE